MGPRTTPKQPSSQITLLIMIVVLFITVEGVWRNQAEASGFNEISSSSSFIFFIYSKIIVLC